MASDANSLEGSMFAYLNISDVYAIRVQTYFDTLTTSTSQWAFGAKMTSYRRRCDVNTSHRR